MKEIRRRKFGGKTTVHINRPKDDFTFEKLVFRRIR